MMWFREHPSFWARRGIQSIEEPQMITSLYTYIPAETREQVGDAQLEDLLRRRLRRRFNYSENPPISFKWEALTEAEAVSPVQSGDWRLTAWISFPNKPIDYEVDPESDTGGFL